jgi:hypothetical protein
MKLKQMLLYKLKFLSCNKKDQIMNNIQQSKIQHSKFKINNS